MARRRRCGACQCILYEDEGSYCQDCRGIMLTNDGRKGREKGAKSPERIGQLAARSALGLPLFERGERDKPD